MRRWNLALSAMLIFSIGVAVGVYRDIPTQNANATPINMKIGNTGAGGVEMSRDGQIVLLPAQGGTTFTSGTLSMNGMICQMGATRDAASKMLHERRGATVIMSRPAREFVVQLIPPQFPEEKDDAGNFAPVINHVFRVEIPGYRARIFTAEMPEGTFKDVGAPDYDTSGTVKRSPVATPMPLVFKPTTLTTDTVKPQRP